MTGPITPSASRVHSSNCDDGKCQWLSAQWHRSDQQVDHRSTCLSVTGMHLTCQLTAEDKEDVAATKDAKDEEQEHQLPG